MIEGREYIHPIMRGVSSMGQALVDRWDAMTLKFIGECTAHTEDGDLVTVIRTSILRGTVDISSGGRITTVPARQIADLDQIV